MSLRHILGRAPIRYSVLGPSAESLRVSYNAPGIVFRVINMETESSTTPVSADTELSFLGQGINVLPVISYVQGDSVVPPTDLPTTYEALDVNVTPAHATMNITIREPISLELYDA